MKKEDFLDKPKKSKQQYKEGKVHSARVVLKEFREKYSHKVEENKK